jgi:CDP-diacylglycerol--glycerol-3-phosphate 3-phosphatidyltransferase
VKPLGLGWPNLVSILRAALVPVIVVLILAEERAAMDLAAVLFVAGALTDGLDGYLARRHGMTTTMGQWLDPLSDKLFVSAPMVTLTLLGRFPVWAAVVILAREIAVSGLRSRSGRRDPRSSSSRCTCYRSRALPPTSAMRPSGSRWC